jgi:hypothetical protein
MAAETHTIKGWGARLSLDGEALTLEEARTYAAMSTADRTLEMLTKLTDIQMRLQRLETFVALVFPKYDAGTTAILKALAEQNGVPHAV